MKNTKTNVGSFATAKLQAKRRSLLAILVIVLVFTMAVVGCDDDPTDNNGNESGELANPSDFTYTETENAITITKYNGQGGSVNIPAQINGKPVTSIGDSAFWGCTSLTSVTIRYQHWESSFSSLQDYQRNHTKQRYQNWRCRFYRLHQPYQRNFLRLNSVKRF